MKAYLKRVSIHPGLPVAIMFTISGAGVGMMNESFSILGGAIFGATVCGLLSWPFVLITAMRDEE